MLVSMGLKEFRRMDGVKKNKRMTFSAGTSQDVWASRWQTVGRGGGGGIRAR